MSMKRPFLLSLAFLSALPSWAGGLYPTECGSLRRENHNLSPSGIQGPLKIQWMTPPCADLGYPVSNPIILSDRVLQAFRYGMRCYDRATGDRIWSWSCNKATEIFNGPCYDADRGRVYLGCVNGDTVAFDPADGKVLWSLDHQPSAYPWQFSTPLYAEGRIFVGNGGHGFLCVDPDTRQVLWNLDFPTYFATPGYNIGTCTPAYDNGTIYLATENGVLFSIRASDGHINWSVNQGFERLTCPLVTDEYVYTLGRMSNVECRSRVDGSLVWKADTHTVVGDTSGCLAICGDQLIVPGDSWRVWGLNRFTGEKVWCTKLTGNYARNTPIVVCGKVFISACHGDFYGLDGQTGKIEWRLFHAQEYTFVGWGESDGQLYVANRPGNMFCFTPQVPGSPSLCACNLNATPLPTQTPQNPGEATFTPTPWITSIPMRNPACPVTDTPTPTITLTPTVTWSPTVTATGTQSPALTPMVTPTSTGSVVPAGTVTVLASLTPTATPSFTPTVTVTFTPTSTPTGTASRTSTGTPTVTPETVCDPKPYPNPCDGGKVHLKVGAGPYDRIELKVFTTGFRVVAHHEHKCEARVEEDLEWEPKDDGGKGLCNGIYYLVVETDQRGRRHHYTEKLLILK